jgi:hypothetical protein
MPGEVHDCSPITSVVSIASALFGNDLPSPQIILTAPFPPLPFLTGLIVVPLDEKKLSLPAPPPPKFPPSANVSYTEEYNEVAAAKPPPLPLIGPLPASPKDPPNPGKPY